MCFRNEKNIICHRRRCRYQTDINVTLGLTVNGECSVNYKYMRHGETPVSSDHDRDQRASPASPALPFSGVFWRRELHCSASSSSGNNNISPFDRGPDNIGRWVLFGALIKKMSSDYNHSLAHPTLTTYFPLHIADSVGCSIRQFNVTRFILWITGLISPKHEVSNVHYVILIWR